MSAQESVSSLKARIAVLEAEAQTREEWIERFAGWANVLTTTMYMGLDAKVAFEAHERQQLQAQRQREEAERLAAVPRWRPQKS